MLKKDLGQLVRFLLTAILGCLCLPWVGASPVMAAPLSSVIRVAPPPVGNDAPGCGSEALPCGTIQYAVNLASLGDTILVAAGTYDAPTSCLDNSVVVCIVNKEVTILGGYTPDNWSTANPEVNVTIIDGQGVRRGVLVQRTGPYEPTASLRMEGFTIQHGRVVGASSGDDMATFAFGGGMITDASKIILRNMIFKNNQAIGGSTSQSYGGAGSGGGLALRTSPAGTVLENVVFEGNEAKGGTGTTRGGLALGGGFYTYQAVVSGSYLSFTNNAALAGSSSGNGRVSGLAADAQGGAAAFQIGSSVTLQYVTATDNLARGGDAGTYAGGAFGGAIKAEHSTIELADVLLRDNQALGGNGANGGLGCGGALETSSCDLSLSQALLIANKGTGGDGSSLGGAAGGGGASLSRFGGSTVIEISNSVFADNLAEMGSGPAPGGGGGGLWLQGTNATIIHTTFAQNRLGSSPMQGQGILVLNDGAPTASTVEILYSVIANHTTYPGAAALHVKYGNSATLRRTLWAGNSKDTNAGEPGAGTIVDIDPIRASSPGFVAPGAPHYDYHLVSNSQAVDQAQDSSMSVDMDGEARPANSSSDIGADEYTQPALLLLPPLGTNQTLDLAWEANLSLMAELDRFDVTVSCEPGARPPDQGPCDSPFSVGQQFEFVLTGLSNGRTYAITVEAWDTVGALLATSNTAAGVPRDFAYKAFIPFVTR